jgi:hypothetical protein
MEIENNQQNRVVSFFKNLLSGLINLVRRFFYWLKMPVPRWRPAAAILLLFAIVWGILIHTSLPTYAATFTFVQNSWSGGVSGSAASHPTNETGWTKYSALTNADTTSGVKTATYSTTKNENFSTTDTTADKDSPNTSATWSSSAVLQIPTGSLIRWWKLDEGSGTSAIDSSGGGFTGTINGGTYSSLAPSVSFADSHSLNVGASTNYVDLGTPYSGKNNYTVSAWVYFNTIPTINHQATIFGWGTTYFGSNGITLSIGFNNWQIQKSNGIINTTTPAPVIHQWIHVAMVISSNTTQLYVNGSLVGSDTSGSLPGNGSDFKVGYVGTDPGVPAIDAQVDDVRFYNSALSSSQITTIASGGLGITYPSGSNVAQSLKVNTPTDDITSATLTKTDAADLGTVTYYLSNDGGTTFNQVTPGSQYTFTTTGNNLRWKIVLTSDATVSSISIAYNSYHASADLTSSAYDTGDPGNLIAKVAWTTSGESGNEAIKMQIRSSPDGNTWSGWCGAADTGTSCSGSNYFTSANNNVAIGSTNPLRSNADDEWFEYKVTLLSDGSATATLNSVTITYVVNAPPEFNSTNGLTVSQVTDSNDANYGKVAITYSIRDTDTSTGTVNPGFVAPSFEYNIGGSYVAITSGFLSANATALKAVDGNAFTTYTAYWDAKSQIANNYLTTAKVRVTLNDNEAANNTAQSVSANFTLDTKSPVLSAFAIDVTQGHLTINASDDTALQYRISNNSDLSADGLNATSGQWQSAGGNSINITPSWNFAAVPDHTTVYLQVRDTAGNTVSSTGVAPNAPGNMYIRDISDVSKSSFAMFVSWGVYTSVAGATFQKYEVYRSTDGSSYGLQSTVTDRTINYFADFGLTQDQTYYYKIRTIDTDGDIGGYSSVVSQPANGQGGGTNNVPPAITAVTVAEVQSTYAKISWTTDELSDSRVDYSIAPDTSFSLGGQSVASFVLNHSVTLTNLTPNTNYLFRVQSIDPSHNTGTNDNDGAGFSFTTTGGPTITNVTQSSINDNSADIVWNTNKDSDSFVTYSTNSDLSASTRIGSSVLVGGTGPAFNHSVSLTGLSAGTKYYFFVESTDASNNYSKDNNGGNYYNFTTPIDATPPVISNVATPVIALTAAVVTWQTDKPATTQLAYGTSTGDYTATTTLDPTLTIFHAIALNDLAQSTQYFYVVKSQSASGHEATSPEGTFTTGTTPVLAPGGVGGSGNSTLVPDTTPPVISNIKAENITAFKADIAFDTNENSVGIIEYGVDPNNLIQSAGDAVYSEHHAISLSGLAPGTKYTFEVVAVDKSGNSMDSDSQDFTTKFFTESTINIKDAYAFQQQVDDAIEAALPSLVPPFIEKPQVTDITDSSATVTWRTNVKAYSAVAYASKDEYDSTKDDPYVTEVSDTTNKVTSHSLKLTGLKSNTLYHFIVKAFTLPQLQSKTDDMTFITEALKISAQISEIKNDSFRAIWSTVDPTTSIVEYRNVKTGETNQKSLEDKALDHDILVDNLTPGTTYEVNVFGINADGNKVSTASAVRVTTSVDITPPKILSLKISSALLPGTTDRTQTIISWKTDEPANSTVFYQDGIATPNQKLANKVEITNDFTTDHAVVVSTLKPGGLYSIQVDSVDTAGNETLLPIRTIVVPQQSQSILDIVFKNFEDTFQFLQNVNK